MLHFSLFVRPRFFASRVSSRPVLVVVGAAVQDIFESNDLRLAARAAFSPQVVRARRRGSSVSGRGYATALKDEDVLVGNDGGHAAPHLEGPLVWRGRCGKSQLKVLPVCRGRQVRIQAYHPVGVPPFIVGLLCVCWCGRGRVHFTALPSPNLSTSVAQNEPRDSLVA